MLGLGALIVLIVFLSQVLLLGRNRGVAERSPAGGGRPQSSDVGIAMGTDRTRASCLNPAG